MESLSTSLIRVFMGAGSWTERFRWSLRPTPARHWTDSASIGIESRSASAQDIIAMSGEFQLKPAGALPMTTFDGKPALLQHAMGRGKAYLLNYFLDQYPRQKQEGENQEALARLGKVLETAGVQPKIRLCGEDG